MKKNIEKNSQGVVYVEFLLVFPPLFLLFLVILQFSILAVSDLGVRHAAASAARSASVVLPDDPIAYEGAPINIIDYQSGCSGGFTGKFATFSKAIGIDSLLIPADGKCPGGPRMDNIRFAAIMRMLPFSPNPSAFMPSAAQNISHSTGSIGWLAGAAAYSYGATGITFPVAPGSSERRTNYHFTENGIENPNTTVRVSYMAHCAIPLARYFMCDSSHSLALDTDLDGIKKLWDQLQKVEDVQSLQTLNTILENNKIVRKRISAAQSRLDDLAIGVGNRSLFALLLLSGERFSLLSAEATLPLNTAPYAYQE